MFDASKHRVAIAGLIGLERVGGHDGIVQSGNYLFDGEKRRAYSQLISSPIRIEFMHFALESTKF